LKLDALHHLGIDPQRFGERFERRVRELFDKSLSDREIGRVLNVGWSTVNRRTKKWRKLKGKRKRRRLAIGGTSVSTIN
jgi:Trp operon repressor